LVLTRELYGILQSLNSRPFSKGHDGAVDQAKRQLRVLGAQLADVPRSLLTDSHVALVRLFIDSLADLPPEVVARTLAASFHEVLRGAEDPVVEPPCSFVATVPETIEIEQIVVGVGSTIGLGDEFLLARALHERARELGRVKLSVSSHNIDLWTCQSDGVGRLAPPPFGAYAFIESLATETRARTAYLYFDFLVSDPSQEPYAGPSGVPYAGRWYMGAGEGEFVHVSAGMRYHVRYPDGLPQCRWLESQWAASRALPGRPLADDEEAWPGPSGERRGHRVVVQALTAKPGLTFPPAFYSDVFGQVLRKAPDLQLEIIPSPTTKGQAVAREIAAAIDSVQVPVRVTLPEPMSLYDVYGRLRKAAILFGPDTFSAHLAAQQGLAQVTISLPEHRPWVTLGSPCLRVLADLPQREIVAMSASRIVALLEVQLGSLQLNPLAKPLRTHLRAIDRMVKRYLQRGSLPRQEEVAERVAGVRTTYAHAVEILNRSAQLLPPRPLGEFPSFDPSVYRDPEDMTRALARWYQQVGLSDVVGLVAAG
jgi:hypothetical protein